MSGKTRKTNKNLSTFFVFLELILCREFTLAEIEHFVDPLDKSHPKFASVKNYVLPLLSRKSQDERTGPLTITIGEAVEKVLEKK